MNLSDLESMYIYPNYKGILSADSNDYLRNLKSHLGKYYNIVSKEGTDYGLMDILLKLRKVRILYFNWIEELPEKKFGLIQIGILWLILILSKISDTKIVWFIHNNSSHNNNKVKSKLFITKLMIRYADYFVSHSDEVKFKIPKDKLHVFHHPIENRDFLQSTKPFKYDILVWGRISKYKGIADFLKYNHENTDLNEFKIAVAGRFASPDYKQKVLSYKAPNVTILEGILEENELVTLLTESKYVLFAYNSPSILSSGALSHTLSYGKAIIGPDVGSFKEHGEDERIYNYQNYNDVSYLLNGDKNGLPPINSIKLKEYIAKTGWEDFTDFLYQTFTESPQ